MGLGIKNKLNVEIGGQSLTVASDDEEGYVRELAHFVDAKMHEVAERGKAAGTLPVAILAALNIADELYKLRREHEQWCQQVDELSRRMLATLDERGEVLGGGG